MIAKTKWGNCSLCQNKDCAVVKVGKELFCTNCHKRNKVKEQIQKASIRNSVRLLGSTEANKDMVDNNAAKQRWFNDRRKEMTGVCANCSGKSCRDSDEYFRFSIAHILPKAYFKSIATNKYNWVELCHFGNGCHSQMDNKMLDLIDMNCFDTIIERFVKMYPHISQDEKKRIPSILLEYVKTEIQ